MEEAMLDIKIIQQPPDTFKFRTYSEKDEKHGVLEIRGSKSRQPKITAEFKRNCPSECFVMINLCNTDSSDKNHLILSRHLIQKRQPMEPITTQLLHGKMTPTENAPNTFEYELSDATIFSPYETKQKDPEKQKYHKSNVLNEKYIEYVKWKKGKDELSADEIENIKIHCQVESDKKLSDVSRNARLSFTVYSKIPDTNKPIIHGTEYSDIIVNAKAFYIKTICNTHVSTAGGQIMYVLLSDIKYNKLTVYIYEKYEKSWEIIIEEPKKWVGNNTISFSVPEYKNESTDMRIDCYLKIKAEENDIKIEAQPELFFYVNNEFEVLKNKRLKVSRPIGSMRPGASGASWLVGSTPDPYRLSFLFSNVFNGLTNTTEDNKRNDVNMELSTVDRAEESIKASQIQVLKKIKADYVQLEADKEFLKQLHEHDNAYMKKHGVSIFYDAIAYNRFAIYISIGSKVLNKYLASLTNERMENLLHYACKAKRSKYILDLIKIGCEIDAQDIKYYSTPLHIAIKSDHTECVEEFIKLIQERKSSGKVHDALINLVTLYDLRGSTVVHAAAECNEIDLMKTMLEMCRVAKIDILHTKTLSLEHSILDLAAKGGHTEMEDLIREALKNDAYANYISLDDNDG